MYKFQNTAIGHSSVTVMAAQNLDLIDGQKSGYSKSCAKRATEANSSTPDNTNLFIQKLKQFKKADTKKQYVK